MNQHSSVAVPRSCTLRALPRRVHSSTLQTRERGGASYVISLVGVRKTCRVIRGQYRGTLRKWGDGPVIPNRRSGRLATNRERQEERERQVSLFHSSKVELLMYKS